MRYVNNSYPPILGFFLLVVVSFSIVEGRIGSEVKDALENIPDWLKEYVTWHNIQRRDHMNDPKTKFLTMACLEESRCGGISDRLRPLPFMLLLAKKMDRVLLIKWQKGFDLESFLLPPDGGIDWRLPEGMDLGTSEDNMILFKNCESVKIGVVHSKLMVVVHYSEEFLINEICGKN